MKYPTLQAKLEAHQRRKDFSLVKSAARMLKDDDIRLTGNVALAWDNYEKHYIPEVEPIVRRLIEIGTPRLLIPAKAKTAYSCGLDAEEITDWRYINGKV